MTPADLAEVRRLIDDGSLDATLKLAGRVPALADECEALRADVERLTIDRDEARSRVEYPWCPECRVTVTKCDEDRCCVSCGVDLIEQSARAESAEASKARLAAVVVAAKAYLGTYPESEKDMGQACACAQAHETLDDALSALKPGDLPGEEG